MPRKRSNGEGCLRKRPNGLWEWQIMTGYGFDGRPKHKSIYGKTQKRQPAEPLIFHTDRGSNYHSKTFCALLRSLGVTQSFSRAHIPYDNSVMESFFSNLKREELYRTKYRSENEFRTAVDKYMIFYNEQRLHAKNGYKTPSKKESDFFNKQALLDLKSN